MTSLTGSLAIRYWGLSTGTSRTCSNICSQFFSGRCCLSSQAGAERSNIQKGFHLNLPHSSGKIGLPKSRVLYTVLRSPHIDKKSREQFCMITKKELMVIKRERSELSKMMFWLKRQRIFGAQCEMLLSCKTHLDKEKLQRLLQNDVLPNKALAGQRAQPDASTKTKTAGEAVIRLRICSF